MPHYTRPRLLQLAAAAGSPSPGPPSGRKQRASWAPPGVRPPNPAARTELTCLKSPAPLPRDPAAVPPREATEPARAPATAWSSAGQGGTKLPTWSERGWPRPRDGIWGLAGRRPHLTAAADHPRSAGTSELTVLIVFDKRRCHQFIFKCLLSSTRLSRL